MKRYALVFLFLFGCSEEPAPQRTDGLEDGSYITSLDHKVNFFCTSVWTANSGINGTNCVDITCEFAGDRRIRSAIVVREGVVMESKNFNYKLVPCGQEIK